MPDGTEPITALSRNEVQRIVDRFASLNPYDMEGSILKIHKLNLDANKQPRQLFGLRYRGQTICVVYEERQRHRDRRAHSRQLARVYIGKESDRHWEDGEDLSLLESKAIDYKRKGYVVATEEQLARIARVPKREFMRRGINQHTLEKICAKVPVRLCKLSECLTVLPLTSESKRYTIHVFPPNDPRAIKTVR